jgi:hypothetical protein
LLLAATLAVLRAGADPLHVQADHEVTVADGDTLSVIALMWYGDAGYADAIATYNQLADPDSLTPGQVLRLPEIPNTPVAPISTAADGPVPGPRVGTGAGGAPGPAAPPPVVQMGLATWYGPGFEGQTTKCGQVFRSSGLTASSNDLPCGTVIDVTNIQNGRSVVVTVDDTGDFQHPTILDLSPAAFSAIGSPATGVLEVSVSRLR